jgi:hypothetical protein
MLGELRDNCGNEPADAGPAHRVAERMVHDTDTAAISKLQRSLPLRRGASVCHVVTTNGEARSSGFCPWRRRRRAAESGTMSAKAVHPSPTGTPTDSRSSASGRQGSTASRQKRARPCVPRAGRRFLHLALWKSAPAGCSDSKRGSPDMLQHAAQCPARASPMRWPACPVPEALCLSKIHQQASTGQS